MATNWTFASNKTELPVADVGKKMGNKIPGYKKTLVTVVSENVLTLDTKGTLLLQKIILYLRHER